MARTYYTNYPNYHYNMPIQGNILGAMSDWDLFDPKGDYGISIGYRIFETLTLHKDVIGQVDEETGEQISFGEMLDKSVRCAFWLDITFKISYGTEIIPICSRNHIDAYVPFLAALYLESIANPLDDVFYNADAVSQYIIQKKPKIIFVDTYYFHFILYVISTLEDCNTQIIRLCRDPGDILFPTLEDIFNDCNKFSSNENFTKFCCSKHVYIDQIAAIVFSPGTVATPRIVKIFHGLFLDPCGSQYQQAPDMRTGDVSLWLESLAFSTGIFLTIHAILLRAKVIRIKANKFEIQEIAEIINKHMVTWVFLETSICMQIIKNADIIEQCVSLKTLVYGGSADYKSRLGKFLTTELPEVSIIEIYNTTEIGGILCQEYIKNRRFVEYFSQYILVSCLKVVSPEEEDSHEEMSEKQFGQIVYISPFSQYCRNQSTQISDEDDLSLNLETLWYFTGDYGYYTKKGNIYIESRMSDLFTYRDLIKITVSEIEYNLRIHPIVNDVAVVIVPHIIYNSIQNVIVAFFSPRIKTRMQYPILKNIMKSRFPYIKYFWFVYMKNLPRLSNGKIHRRKLCEIAKIEIDENAELFSDLMDYAMLDYTQ